MASFPDALAVLFPNFAVTRDIGVRVAVSYLAEQSNPSLNRWFWSYHIRIENGSDASVQLLSRNWQIVDGHGTVHQVQGEGVVGETPLIAPGSSFDYVSGCPLDTPGGAMSGSYRMVDEDGALFDVTIPRFALVAPTNKAIPLNSAEMADTLFDVDVYTLGKHSHLAEGGHPYDEAVANETRADGGHSRCSYGCRGRTSRLDARL